MSKPGVMPRRQFVRRCDRVGALHAQHEAERRMRALGLGLPGPPASDVPAQRIHVFQHDRMAIALERPVPRHLTTHDRFRLRNGHAGAARVRHSGGTCEQRCDRYCHAPLLQFRQRDRAITPTVSVQSDLTHPDLSDGSPQIATPLERVPGEVEMGVDDQHQALSFTCSHQSAIDSPGCEGEMICMRETSSSSPGVGCLEPRPPDCHRPCVASLASAAPSSSE